jgi:uncharacterized membrane protein
MGHHHLHRKLKQRVMRMGETPSPFRRLRNPRLAPVVERNINTIVELRDQVRRNRCLQERVADAITAWSGSMWFVYVHVAWFGLWIPINLHLTRFPAFDPYPFGLLTMIVSLEAIFLATFVLISQNRQATVDSQRNDLDLQVDLLAEYELTRVLALVDAIADHLGLDAGKDPELDELKRDTAPAELMQEMQQRQHASAGQQPGDHAQKSSKEGPANGQPAKPLPAEAGARGAPAPADPGAARYHSGR